MPAPKDLIHESSTTTGTGDFTVAAVNGKVRFSDSTYGFGTGGTDVFDYYISSRAQSEWERGTGHMSDANTLVRDTVIESSNSNNAVNFSAGTKDVTNDIPAGEQLRSLQAVILPRGRLTLTSGTPVMTSGASAQTTIYYTPFNGNIVPIYDGTKFVPTVFSELSLALSSNSGHTGYHQSGKNFDLFVINDSGTIRLASGPAWTNDSTRAESLSRINGILVSDASIVLRFGSASGNTVTYTGRATYVGTFRATANGQTSLTNARGFLVNYYNREAWNLKGELTTSRTTTSASFAEFNSEIRIEWLAIENVEAAVSLVGTGGNSVVATVGFGIAVDSTTAVISSVSDTIPANTYRCVLGFSAVPKGLSVGYHYATLLGATNAGTLTAYGAAGTTSSICTLMLPLMI